MSDEKQPTLHDPHMLNLREPEKWQMKIRLHLEKLPLGEAEDWVAAYRLNLESSAKLVRARVLSAATGRCCICEKPFREGRPAGEGFYVDADKQPVHVYVCTQSEFGDMLKMIQRKEDQIARWQEKSDKAARDAAVAARSAHPKELPT